MDEVSLEELRNELMDNCSNGTTSHECSGLLTVQRGHDLGLGLDARLTRVLTRRRLPDDFSPSRGVMQPPPRTPPPVTTTGGRGGPGYMGAIPPLAETLLRACAGRPAWTLGSPARRLGCVHRRVGATQQRIQVGISSRHRGADGS